MTFLHHHRTGLTVVALLGVVRVVWRPPEAVCEPMTFWECISVAVLVVAALTPVAIGVRAAVLGIRVQRAVRALPASPAPATLTAAATSVGIHHVLRLDDQDVVAFCTGLLWPRVYVSEGALRAFGTDELQAVLAHEATHARRRDPLRRLLARASADVLFFVPLVGWWTGRQQERSELSADRSALSLTGPRALARALSIAGGPVVAAAPGFEGAAQARVAQLLGEPVPYGRPSGVTVGLSAVALVLSVSLAMCVGQGALMLVAA